jgi:hypothetical protein
MTKSGSSKSGFWTVVAVVNLLALAYPVSMLCGADTQEGIFVGIFALCAVALVLGVADIIGVLLAYSTSY